MKIGSKIIASFAVTSVLLVCLLALAVTSMRSVVGAMRGLLEARIPSLVSVMVLSEAQIDVSRALHALSNEEVVAGGFRADLYDEAGAAFRRMDEAWAGLEAGRAQMPPELAARVADLAEPWAAWRKSATAVIALEKELDEQISSGLGRGSPEVHESTMRIGQALLEHRRAYNDSQPRLHELLGAVRALASEEGRRTERRTAGASVQLTVFILVVIAATLTIGVYIARDLTRMFGEIRGRLDRLAAGDMPPPLSGSRGEDYNAVRDSLNTCIAALDGLLAEMGRMAERQAAGDMDAYVDEAAFQGAYRQMAAGVNAGVRMHVANVLELLKVLGSYSDGDFEPVLRPLPGKQVVINEKLERVRTNLRSFSAEVQGLARAAVEGDLSTRADPARYRGDWRALVPPWTP
jgi:methyl-accepting chemotaxis protein